MDSPSALDRAKKLQVQQELDTFMRAMKAMKFKQALRTAETILNLDPGNMRVKEFIPLLEEKVAMDDEEDDEDEDGSDDSKDGDEAGPHDAGEQQEDQDATETSSSGSDDDEDEEEEEDGDEEGEVDKGASDQIAAHPATQRRRWLNDSTLGEASSPGDTPPQVTQLSLDASNSQLSHGQRRRIRDDLARSIAGLKAQELEKRIMDSDPLLGA